MKRCWIIFILAVLAAASVASYMWFARSGRETVKNAPPSLSSQNKTEGPAALVQVDRIREGTITSNIKVYGNIVPAPGAIKNISVPYESHHPQHHGEHRPGGGPGRFAAGNRTQSQSASESSLRPPIFMNPQNCVLNMNNSSSISSWPQIHKFCKQNRPWSRRSRIFRA